jgi:hypothetical protein
MARSYLMHIDIRAVCIYLCIDVSMYLCISSIKPPTQRRVSATANGATVVAPTRLAPFRFTLKSSQSPPPTQSSSLPTRCTVRSGRPAGDNKLGPCTLAPKHKRTLNLKPDLALPALSRLVWFPRTMLLSGPAYPRTSRTPKNFVSGPIACWARGASEGCP